MRSTALGSHGKTSRTTSPRTPAFTWARGCRRIRRPPGRPLMRDPLAGTMRRVSTFELYLIKDSAAAADLDAVVDALLGTGVIEPSPGEEDRVWYRNPHTGVAFPIVFSF